MAWGRGRTRARTQRGWAFRTKQPHHWTYLVALVLAIVGVVGTQTRVEWVSPHAIWLVLAAYVLLALACVIDGL